MIEAVGGKLDNVRLVSALRAEGLLIDKHPGLILRLAQQDVHYVGGTAYQAQNAVNDARTGFVESPIPERTAGRYPYSLGRPSNSER